MTASFILTPSAARDVEGIIDFVLESSGADRALYLHKRLYEGFAKIGAMPNVGHMRDDLGDESLRVYTVFKFLVIFRPDTKPVQILRVIHGARDLPMAFSEEP